MRELAAVKVEEGRILEAEIGGREEMLRTVETYEHKTKGLDAKISEMENEDGEVGRLKLEKEEVDGEVRDLEHRLAVAKARQRWLEQEVQRAVNEREARVSSYREARRAVESEVKAFLKRSGVGARWRTLGVVKEGVEGEAAELEKRKEEVETEREALEEGEAVWRDVVGVVSGVERALREEMARVKDGRDMAAGMKDILGRMDEAVAVLEERFETADRKGWKLLVCAIGAELEAFREGREVLKAALDANGKGESEKHEEEDAADGARNDGIAHGVENTTIEDEDLGTPPFSAVQGERTRVPQSLLDRSEDEDDEPDPDLLISHQEDDEPDPDLLISHQEDDE